MSPKLNKAIIAVTTTAAAISSLSPIPVHSADPIASLSSGGPVWTMEPDASGQFFAIAGAERILHMSDIGHGMYGFPAFYGAHVVAFAPMPVVIAAQGDFIIAYDFTSTLPIWSKPLLAGDDLKYYSDYIHGSQYLMAGYVDDYELRDVVTDELLATWDYDSNSALSQLPDFIANPAEGVALVGNIVLESNGVQDLAVLRYDGSTTSVVTRRISSGCTRQVALTPDVQFAAFVFSPISGPNQHSATLHVLSMIDLQDYLTIPEVPIARDLRYSPDGSKLAVLSSGTAIDVYETIGYTVTETIPLPEGEYGTALAWLADGATLVIGTQGGNLWMLKPAASS
ncbi:MAG: hypothetical protein RLY93_14455 [Sumerlaeia bacterium]